MEKKPAYMRGRGRGRGGPVPAPPRSARSPVSPGDQHRAAAGVNGSSSTHSSGDSTDRFQDAALKHREAAQRHLVTTEDDYESSEEEEDLDDEKILKSVLTKFSHTNAPGEVGPGDLGRTQEYLTNSVKSKANICLICIETIKRTEAIWSCHGCYTIFHIACIQRWVKDGVYQQNLQSEEDLKGVDLPWNCPKCRYEYKQSQCPTRYFCFCGKAQDPPADPWLVPHSCGEVCSDALKPECGHACLLLCHPGPCPPCPKTVRVSCYCGQRSPQVRRCGTRAWSCGLPCSKALVCGHHQCQTPCHEGECPPCPEKSMRRCECGQSSAIQPCIDSIWHCEKECGRPLSCGQHTCEQVCHSGDCGGCPRAGSRHCPCGKSQFEMPCTEDIPTCVDTCGKTLECGVHECNQRCHYGPCGLCREMTKKTCRCGKKAKEVQCYKEYQCDTKCLNMKDCRKHACKRKCCDGNCPSCDLLCNKPLGCHNHKCSSRCHRGQCYPCPLTVKISCNCGTTSVTVPCGREKVTRPPRCNQQCRKPPNCHHAQSRPHRCHFNPCPPCGQVCDRSRQRCEHRCPAICHTAVLTKVQEKVQRAGPWEAVPEARLELMNYPCPPCQSPVPVTCLGKHETVPMPCSTAAVGCCHRPCGTLLPCGNHTCEFECHSIVGAIDDQSAGTTCQICEEPCTKPRLEGCNHPCLLPCHPELCPPCAQMIRMRCHCKQLLKHIECDEWVHADDIARARLQSCQSKCPKPLSCGHPCQVQCHTGECADPARCVEKVSVRCNCKRRRTAFLCNEVQGGYGSTDCDEMCEEHKEKLKKEREEKNRRDLEEAKKREEREIAEYKRKMEPRKRKQRKPKQEVEEPRFLQKYSKFIVAPVLVVLLSGFVYYLVSTS